MAIKRRVYVVAVIFLLLLLTPFINLSRYMLLEAETTASEPSNIRNAESLELRGRLLDRGQGALAYSRGQTRVYPLGEAAGALVGYFTMAKGAAGLEHSFAGITEGRVVPRNPVSAVVQASKGDLQGDDVVLTIDRQLQEKVYERIGGYRGAVVVMSAKTGELLALVSRPSFDPNRVDDKKYWQGIITNSSAPLVERCTQGQYPPGSTFKVLVMSGALEDGLTSMEDTFDCKGQIEVGNFILHCMAEHGVVTLPEALIYSCNVAFAELGQRLRLSGIHKWSKRFGLEDKWGDVPGAEAAMLPTNKSASSAAEAAIGQADLLVSPLRMACVAGVIANEGRLVEPHLYKGMARHGKIISEIKTEPGRAVISPKVARLVAQSMVRVVQEGTGGAAALEGVTVAGKTGSAENTAGDTHAWFIGYAPAEDPQIVCAVILENAGGGGTYAAPVAGDVLDMALRSIGL